jgi:phage-related protein
MSVIEDKFNILSWLEKNTSEIDKTEVKKILENFNRFGSVYSNNKVPRRKIKYLRDKIFEIKQGQIRIAYSWLGSHCYLLHVIKKKKNKWDEKDIKIAKKRQKLVLNP